MFSSCQTWSPLGCLLILLLSMQTKGAGEMDRFAVVENSETGHLVGTLFDNREASYSFSDEFCGSYFSIHSNSSITVKDQALLDREAMLTKLTDNSLTCIVAVSTGGTVQVEIEVEDLNDEVPKFSGLNQPHFRNLTENINIGSVIMTLQPMDQDNGVNGSTEFSITSGNELNYFQLRVPETRNESTPERDLFIIRELDYDEVGGSISINVTIRDMGNPSLMFVQTITFLIENLQDAAPRFPTSTFEFSVPEDFPVGRSSIFSNVTVLEGLQNIRYSIRGSSFNSMDTEFIGINDRTGDLYLKRKVDFETQAQNKFYLAVTATNINNQLQAQAAITVTVTDIINEPLYFRCDDFFNPACPSEVNQTDFYITEGATVSIYLIESIGASFEANYSIIPEGAPIRGSPAFNSRYRIFINDMDRETFPVVNVNILARSDIAPFRETLTVFCVRVLDVNDNSPVFLSRHYDGVVFEGSPSGRKIIQVEATDADAGENGTVTYSITSVQKKMARSWFEIEPTTGIISVASTGVNYAAVDGFVTLNVTVRDNGNISMSSSVLVNVTIVQATSFYRNSYLEYSSLAINLMAKTRQNVYLEVLIQNEGLLLYQQDLIGTAFSVSYNGSHVVARFGDSNKNVAVNSTMISDWIGISVNTFHQIITDLSVVAASAGVNSSSPLLRNLTVQSCDSENSTNKSTPIEDHRLSLYIGGANIFYLLGNSSNLPLTTFTGAIRNLIVDNTQLDLSCPHEQSNTKQGVVETSQKCEDAGLECNSANSVGCVDFGSNQPYCQCAGGFSAQACNTAYKQDEETSYAPIRFKGTSGVKLSLEYAFFADLQSSIPDPDASDGSTNEVISRKKRDADVEDVRQKIELEFRVVDLQDSVILSSQTSSSRHSIEILEDVHGGSFLHYSIWPLDSDNVTNVDLQTAIEKDTLYRLKVILKRQQIAVEMSGGYNSSIVIANWESDIFPEVPVLAEQPVTSLAIGGSLQSNSATSHLMGCVTHFAIDQIQFPLNGLLEASVTDGGFEINDSDGVTSHCDLCDTNHCPPMSSCHSSTQGGITCICDSPYVAEAQNDSPQVDQNGTCITLVGALKPIDNSDMYFIIAGCALAALLVFGIFILSIIVACRKKQEKQRERRYSVNNISRINRRNDYSPSILKKKPSFSSSMNANYPTDNHELRSSVSTYQEHAEDGDPDTNSPHHNARPRRKSCTSMESGIKMDDREMGGASMAARGIPTMEDSGHEVNSTDSNRTSESDEVASSCYDPLSLTRGPLVTSPDHHSIPRTPLTPKEKKVMIPLRPPSTNLSQSEYDDEEEAIETESFHTRVSSSSGMGNSMQNQGRGSDTDSSKISDTSRWYLPPSSLDKERGKLNLQTLRAPYHQSHHEDGIPDGTRPYPPNIPPMYHSPPSFSEHVDRNYPRGRSKSVHTGKSSMSPMQPGIDADNTASPHRRRYENYPGDFRDARPNGVMYKENGMHYGAGQFLERELNGRVSNEHDYTPSSLFTRQYSDPKIPRNGTYCIPRNRNEPWPIHNRQISDPQMSSQESSSMYPRGAHSTRHLTVYPSNSTTTTSTTVGSSSIRQLPPDRQFYTLGHNSSRKHVNFAPTSAAATNQQAARSFSSGDSKGAGATNNGPYQTLNSLSKIDPISNWDAQDRMKATVDHMDPCHLLSGPCIPFEYVSTDPSVVESQMTVDESIMGTGVDHQVFDSQDGEEEGMIPNLLDPLEINMVRLGEDEMDSILTDSEVGGRRQVMNHFPSADCSSQYTTTIVAGSTSTSGESTPKVQKVFVLPPSQQSFDV